MNVVDQTLSKMIYAWPTSCESRWQALYKLSTAHGCEWTEDGNFVVREDMIEPGDYCDRGDLEKVEKAEEKAKANPNDWNVEEAVYVRLQFERERNHVAFVRAHADLLARDTSFSAKKPTLYGDVFGRLCIPEHARPEWRAAFVGLAEEILRTRFPAAKYERLTEDALQNAKSNHEAAQKAAREFLIRAKGSDAEKHALAVETMQKKMDALIREAEAAGVIIAATVA